MNARRTTEVVDRDARGALSVSLSKMFALVVAALGPVAWRVFELEATGSGGLDLAVLNERIEHEPAGLLMTADELEKVAADLSQVINAILVVPGDEQPLTLPPLDAAFYSRCRLVVECIDGDLWRVTTEDSEVHTALHKEFQDVTDV